MTQLSNQKGINIVSEEKSIVGLVLQGVNFIKVLRTILMLADPKSVKNTVKS
jgi:hypothetical protein